MVVKRDGLVHVNQKVSRSERRVKRGAPQTTDVRSRVVKGVRRTCGGKEEEFRRRSSCGNLCVTLMETRLVDLHETNEEPRERLRRGEETLEREVNREPPKKQTVPMVSRPSEKPTGDILGKVGARHGKNNGVTSRDLT